MTNLTLLRRFDRYTTEVDWYIYLHSDLRMLIDKKYPFQVPTYWKEANLSAKFTKHQNSGSGEFNFVAFEHVSQNGHDIFKPLNILNFVNICKETLYLSLSLRFDDFPCFL